MLAPASTLASGARADEPGSGECPARALIKWPRRPLASLAGAAYPADPVETSANVTPATSGTFDNLIRLAPVASSFERASIGRGRALRPGILLEQLERPHGAAGRNVGQIGVARAHHVGAGRPVGDGEVLLAVPLPGDRLPDDAGRGLEFEQRLAGVGIERDELAGELAGEDEAARGHERAGEVRALVGHRPLGLAGERVDRAGIAARLGLIVE